MVRQARRDRGAQRVGGGRGRGPRSLREREEGPDGRRGPRGDRARLRSAVPADRGGDQEPDGDIRARGGAKGGDEEPQARRPARRGRGGAAHLRRAAADRLRRHRDAASGGVPQVPQGQGQGARREQGRDQVRRRLQPRQGPRARDLHLREPRGHVRGHRGAGLPPDLQRARAVHHGLRRPLAGAALGRLQRLPAAREHHGPPLRATGERPRDDQGQGGRRPRRVRRLPFCE